MKHLPGKSSQGFEEPGLEHYCPSWTPMSDEAEVALHPEVQKKGCGATWEGEDL